MRMMFSCLFLESWLGRKKERKMEDPPVRALSFPYSWIADKNEEYYSFQSVCLSAAIFPGLPSLYSLCICSPHFSTSISSLFQSLLPRSFFHSFSNHCEIARRLVGDFSDREIWLRSESRASTPAFLSQFKWFCSLTGTPTKKAKHSHIYTFLFCAHARSFICLPLSLLHTHTQTCTYKTQFRSKGGDGTGMRGCSWEKRQRKEDRYRWSHSKVYH